MKTFNQWLIESEESVHDLRNQRKKLSEKLPAILSKIYAKGWSNYSSDELYKEYPNDSVVKALKKINDELELINNKIKEINSKS
jgi:chaperonin cofactor prefoldin